MTKKIFWENPYLTNLKAKISSVDQVLVTLDQTIFYAFSGGQESDSGTIGGYPVLKAEKSEFEIFYTLPEDHTLKVGDDVDVHIDWDRRYKLMRLHFAAELVLELICRKYPSTEKVGAHIAQDKARIDFQWPENISKILPEIQAEAQKIIDSHQPIISALSVMKRTNADTGKSKSFPKFPAAGRILKARRKLAKFA